MSPPEGCDAKRALLPVDGVDEPASSASSAASSPWASRRAARDGDGKGESGMGSHGSVLTAFIRN